MNIRKGRAALAGIAACFVLGGVTLGTQAAEADPLPLTPTLDCVVPSASGTFTAYFGYTNTGPVSIAFPVGDFNQVVPGIADQGQPVTFDVGAYPKVFAVPFDPVVTPVVSWVLNGPSVRGRLHHLRAVHLAQRVGEQLEPHAVRVAEVDRRA
ncbi:MAG TPA: hypothetical protein VMG13_08840, partial [Trebonia sp.]|nr:hypothetical protein [Trebonia sp.]